MSLTLGRQGGIAKPLKKRTVGQTNIAHIYKSKLVLMANIYLKNNLNLLSYLKVKLLKLLTKKWNCLKLLKKLVKLILI